MLHKLIGLLVIITFLLFGYSIYTDERIFPRQEQAASSRQAPTATAQPPRRPSGDSPDASLGIAGESRAEPTAAAATPTPLPSPSPSPSATPSPTAVVQHVTLKGVITNAVTGTPITGGSLWATSPTATDRTGEWTSDGEYRITLRSQDSFTLSAKATGYAMAEYTVLVGFAGVQIRTARGQIVHESAFAQDTPGSVAFDIALPPDAILAARVVDLRTGAPVSGAEVTLLDEAEELAATTTASDGELFFRPPVLAQPRNFTLRTKASGYRTENTQVYLGYEVDPQTDRYRLRNWNGVIALTTSDETAGRADAIGKGIVGAHTIDFSRPSRITDLADSTGVTIEETSTGTLTLTFSQDPNDPFRGSVTCSGNISSSLTTTFSDADRPPMQGTGSGSAQDCNGSVDYLLKTFRLAGTYRGTMTNDGATEEITGPFTIIGTFLGGTISGTITIPSIQPIPFSG